MSAETEAVIEELVAAHPVLAPVLAEHLADFDELLPYLAMADVVRFLAEHRRDATLCRSVFRWLEARFVGGTDEVRNLIALGGVDEIPDPGQPGDELRWLLGPALRAVDSWGPGT